MKTANPISKPSAFARSSPSLSLINQNQGGSLATREVQGLDDIAAELADQIAECRAAYRGAERRGNLAPARILLWIVGHAQSRRPRRTHEKSVVRDVAAAVSLADEWTSASVDRTIDKFVAFAELIVARILMKDRRQDRVGEDPPAGG